MKADGLMGDVNRIRTKFKAYGLIVDTELDAEYLKQLK